MSVLSYYMWPVLCVTSASSFKTLTILFRGALVLFIFFLCYSECLFTVYLFKAEGMGAYLLISLESFSCFHCCLPATDFLFHMIMNLAGHCSLNYNSHLREIHPCSSTTSSALPQKRLWNALDRKSYFSDTTWDTQWHYLWHSVTLPVAARPSPFNLGHHYLMLHVQYCVDCKSTL